MRIYVKRGKWQLAVVCGCLLLLACVSLSLLCLAGKRPPCMNTAAVWRGSSDTRFAQLACFLPENEPKSKTDILQFRHELDQKLLEASLMPPANGSLYADCFCSSGSLTVTANRGTVTTDALGIGGAFFLFHPMDLLCGSYIAERDLMQDRVIMDEILAWQLFGSTQAAGMTVSIDGKPFQVAGVIRRETQWPFAQAHQHRPVLFLSYDAMYAMTEEEITVYELVMPNMIRGFAASIFREQFPTEQGEYRENTDRLSISSLMSVAGDFGTRSMRSNGVIYPYWENAIRMQEDHLALLLVVSLLLLMFPAACLLLLVVKTAARIWKSLSRSVPAKLEQVRERRREEAYAKTGGK